VTFGEPFNGRQVLLLAEQAGKQVARLVACGFPSGRSRRTAID
jgi:hypothetical protein